MFRSAKQSVRGSIRGKPLVFPLSVGFTSTNCAMLPIFQAAAKGVWWLILDTNTPNWDGNQVSGLFSIALDHSLSLATFSGRFQNCSQSLRYSKTVARSPISNNAMASDMLGTNELSCGEPGVFPDLSRYALACSICPCFRATRPRILFP